jgi:predicted  nucleic acid-binding Zn-ribbon protein
MGKPLSEQLANLSVHAKSIEDAAAAAQKEAHDKVVARVAQAQVAAEQAVQKVSQNIQSASDTASAKWNGLKAKIAADMDDLKSKVAQRKHDLDVKAAASYSRLLDEDASFAIDYAIASIEQAKVAVLDAIAAHLEVEKAKRTAA